MRGIDSLGSDQRVDIVEVVVTNQLAVLVIELVVVGDVNILLRQGLEEPGYQLILFCLEFAHLDVTFLDLLRGQAAIDAVVENAGAHLQLEAAYPFHEEFIEVRADDADKLDPFEQRVAFIEGLEQNPAVEFQPGQFAIEIKLWRIQVEGGDGLGGGICFGRAIRAQADIGRSHTACLHIFAIPGLDDRKVVLSIARGDHGCATGIAVSGVRERRFDRPLAGARSQSLCRAAPAWAVRASDLHRESCSAGA